MLGKKVRHLPTGVVGTCAKSETGTGGTRYRIDHSDEKGDHETWAPASEIELADDDAATESAT